VDRAYDWLRERIIDGTISEGTFVDEATVCDAAGVSRTPAREAFNRLEGERFITLVPRKGAQVRTLRSSDLHDTFKARFMVESFAVSNICAVKHAIPPEALRNLSVMDELSDFESIQNTIAYIEADRAFHTAIVRTLENPAIMDFFESLWRHSSRAAFNRGLWLRSAQWLDLNRSHHHAIIAALTNYDAEAAQAVLREHFEQNSVA